MALWTVSNNITLRNLEEGRTLRVPKTGETRPEQLQPIQLGIVEGATVSLISGILPPGLRIIDNTIQGTPLEVARETEFKFVLRATKNNEIDDRTFKINVTGPDVPTWITPAGALPIGNNDTFYILDSSPIDFQLVARDTDTAAGEQLEYFIASGDGELPPGIKLTRDGRLVGVVDPLLALDKLAERGYYDDSPFGAFPYDFGTRSANGYDSFYYDTEFYDYSVPTKSPKKLNRNYQFRVSVSDGDTIEKRLFRIFVVGEDFFRSDNTIMQSGNQMFSADNTFLRTPIWLTPADLGYRRADNFITLYFDVIQNSSILGFVGYDIVNVNDDGSPSVIPPGLTLDPGTGELSGRVPYQPIVTKEYKFTLKATRYVGTATNVREIGFTLYEDVNTQVNLSARLMKPNTRYQIVTANDTDYTQVGAPNNNIGTIFISQGPTSGSGLVTQATSTFPVKIVKNPDTKIFRNQTFNIKGSLFKVSSIDDINFEYDIIYFSSPIDANLKEGETFTKQYVSSDEDTNSSSKLKTFTVKLLGEVDSKIVWNSNEALGSINANLTSVLKIDATTSVPNAVVRYTKISGRLPPGLTLALDGEIFGKVQQFGENRYRSFWKSGREYLPNDIVKVGTSLYKCLITHTSSQDFLVDSAKWEDYAGFSISGLTTFDQNDMTFDGNSTTIDKVYIFTARAEDQYGFSAITKTFKISILDPNDLTFSNIFVKPFLKDNQKSLYNDFISNPIIFDPSLIYRPSDTEFGVQNEIKMLVYAGIENVEAEKFVAAAAKNHKRKSFKFGDVKTAVAYLPGTKTPVYEVIYVDVIDPQDTRNGNVRNVINIKNNKKRLINDISYETKDDTFSNIDTSPDRFRPITNSIKIDSDAISIDENQQTKKYISNLTNMRNRISEIGRTDANFLPLWMRTPQENNIEALGYTPAVVLTYCKPGTANTILANIKNSGFDFTDINFDVDRYIVDSTKGNSNEQYILFANYDFNV